MRDSEHKQGTRTARPAVKPRRNTSAGEQSATKSQVWYREEGRRCRNRSQHSQDRRFGTEPKRSVGKIGGLVPRREGILAKSRDLVPFSGEISSFVPTLGRISKFGTQKSRTAKLRPGISPSAGDQIAEVGRNQGTKPRFLPAPTAKEPPRVPNRRLWPAMSFRQAAGVRARVRPEGGRGCRSRRVAWDGRRREGVRAR